MFDNNINIEAINVELTTARRNQITRSLNPLLRLVDSPTQVTADVAIRKIMRSGGNTYCMMVRVNSRNRTLHAVAMSKYFSNTLREIQKELRRSMSRAYHPDGQTLEHMRAKAHQRYFVELFV